jgi:hypothetical protein
MCRAAQIGRVICDDDRTMLTKRTGAIESLALFAFVVVSVLALSAGG